MGWVLDAPTPADADLSQDEIELARAIVASFVSTRSRLHEEREDLLQECLEHWLRQRGRYDAGRGATRSTFTRRVLQHHLRDLEDGRRAAKRGGGQPPDSFDEPNEVGSSLYDVTGAKQDTAEEATLNLALTRARHRLTPDERRLVDALGQGHAMTEIPHLTGRARSSLYRDLARIREVFKDEGLDEFL